jgi:hypothetical protein
MRFSRDVVAMRRRPRLRRGLPAPRLAAIKEELHAALDKATHEEWAYWIQVAVSADSREAATLILTARECYGPWISEDPEQAVEHVYAAIRDPRARRLYRGKPFVVPKPEHLAEALRAVRAAS